MNRFLLLIIGLLLATTVDAYIGPGAGISVLGSIISVIVGVFLAIGAILFWPIRRVLKRRKAARQGDQPTS